jgi:broad specificity phosphatase PhoE
MARKLLLVRHAAAALPWGDGRLLGRSDPPLAPEGLEQARGIASFVRAAQPTVCYSSPQFRARQTAEILTGSAKITTKFDDDLREIDFGRWEGKTFAEIAAESPQAVTGWADFSDDFTFPGGERLGDFLTRVGGAADRLARDPAEVVLAVSHGGVVRAMICHLLGLSPRNYLLFDVRPAACATIDLFDGRGVLSGLSQSAAAEGR